MAQPRQGHLRRRCADVGGHRDDGVHHTLVGLQRRAVEAGQQAAEVVVTELRGGADATGEEPLAQR